MNDSARGSGLSFAAAVRADLFASDGTDAVSYTHLLVALDVSCGNLALKLALEPLEELELGGCGFIVSRLLCDPVYPCLLYTSLHIMALFQLGK